MKDLGSFIPKDELVLEVFWCIDAVHFDTLHNKLAVIARP